jgi:hypothetical protein
MTAFSDDSGVYLDEGLTVRVVDGKLFDGET